MANPQLASLRLFAPCVRSTIFRPSATVPARAAFASRSSPSLRRQHSIVNSTQQSAQASSRNTVPLCTTKPQGSTPRVVRAASSSASASSTSPSSSAREQTTPLPWNDFFRLRQRRRYFNLASSLLVAGGSFSAGVGYLSQQSSDILGFAGIDPLIGMALLSIGFGVCGWLAGPAIGGGVFRLFYKGAGEMGAKERDFYARIKKYRIDPSSSSMQNPVPDYYGEKITSVAGYRQWLKDQRAFNKKRQSFL